MIWNQDEVNYLTCNMINRELFYFRQWNNFYPKIVGLEVFKDSSKNVGFLNKC